MQQIDAPRLFDPDNIKRALWLCCGPAFVFFVTSLSILSLAGFGLVEILRDPAQLTEQSSFLGFLSNVGSWLWVSAAAICFFRIWVHPRGTLPDHRNLVKLAGHFSLVLAVDDFFLIHDRYIAEGIIIPLYAIFVIYLLVRHRGTILSVDGFAFFLAGGLLFMSVLVDAVQELMPVSYGLSQTFEEGFKFMGGAGWLYFCTRMAAYRLQVAPDPQD